MNEIVFGIVLFAALYLAVGIFWLWQFAESLIEAVQDPLELLEEAASIVFLWPFTINK